MWTNYFKVSRTDIFNKHNHLGLTILGKFVYVIWNYVNMTFPMTFNESCSFHVGSMPTSGRAEFGGASEYFKFAQAINDTQI